MAVCQTWGSTWNSWPCRRTGSPWSFGCSELHSCTALNFRSRWYYRRCLSFPRFSGSWCCFLSLFTLRALTLLCSKWSLPWKLIGTGSCWEASGFRRTTEACPRHLFSSKVKLWCICASMRALLLSFDFIVAFLGCRFDRCLRCCSCCMMIGLGKEFSGSRLCLVLH